MKWKHISPQRLVHSSHSSIIYNSQNIETTEMSISWWLDSKMLTIQNKSTLSIHGGLVPDSIVQWIVHTYEVYICGFNQPQIENVFDLSRNQNVWFWFLWNIQEGKVLEKKSRIRSFQGLGKKWGLIANGEGVSFKNDGNVVKLGGGNDRTTLWIH